MEIKKEEETHRTRKKGIIKKKVKLDTVTKCFIVLVLRVFRSLGKVYIKTSYISTINHQALKHREITS